MAIKAYEHMTGATRIEDPEKQELAARFNKEFTELFKAVPKANTRNLMNMLSLTYEVTCFESLRGFVAGVKVS